MKRYSKYERRDPRPEIPFSEESAEDRWLISFLLIGAFVIALLVLGVEP